MARVQLETEERDALSPLFRQIFDDFSQLVRLESALAEEELRIEGRKVRRALIWGMAAGFLSLITAVLITFALVYLLHSWREPFGANLTALPLWACFFIVSLFIGAVCCFAITRVRKHLLQFHAFPRQMLKSIEEDLCHNPVKH